MSPPPTLERSGGRNFTVFGFPVAADAGSPRALGEETRGLQGGRQVRGWKAGLGGRVLPGLRRPEKPRRAPAAAPSGRGRAPEKQGFRWPGRCRPEDDGGGEDRTGRRPHVRKV